MEVDETELSHVSELAAINPQWAASQFVRVGNPHCVTLVEQVSALPDNTQMQQPALYEPLKTIAFAPPAGGGRPCPAGVNLQWAARQPGNRIIARVFERGRGPPRLPEPAPVRWLVPLGGRAGWRVVRLQW